MKQKGGGSMAAFITGKLLFIALLLLVITAVETLAYSASFREPLSICQRKEDRISRL
jgi:hypothetical protein